MLWSRNDTKEGVTLIFGPERICGLILNLRSFAFSPPEIVVSDGGARSFPSLIFDAACGYELVVPRQIRRGVRCQPPGEGSDGAAANILRVHYRLPVGVKLI